jgi:hypothetical protein
LEELVYVFARFFNFLELKGGSEIFLASLEGIEEVEEEPLERLFKLRVRIELNDPCRHSSVGVERKTPPDEREDDWRKDSAPRQLSGE